MPPANVTRMIAPLEQHASETLQRLRATVVFLRDLQCVEDKYARECSKLPSAVPDKVRRKLATLPALARVSSAFEAFVRAQCESKARLAHELMRAVVAPLDQFADQQARQTRRLVTEIAEALENDHVATTQLTSSGSGSSGSTCDGQQRERCEQLRTQFARRGSARRVVRERLEELHLAEQQQHAVINSALERFVETYRHMLAQSNALTADLQVRVLEWHGSGTVTPTHMAALTPDDTCENGADGCELDSDRAWKSFLKTCERHALVTEWMNSVFTQLVAVEEVTMRRLTAMRKLHPRVDVLQRARDSSSACADVLADLTHFHTLLTVNLLDPISRTLTFSAQKQRRIRKELVQSLDETAKLVQLTRRRVKDRELQHRKWVARSAHSDTAASSASFSAHVADAMKLNLSNFGLRSAVATMSKPPVSEARVLQRSRLTVGSLTDGDDDDDEYDATRTAAVAPVDKELLDAYAYLQSLQHNECEQRREIVATLRSTSLLGVKTMELMVGDYLKHLCKALTALSERFDRLDAVRVAVSKSLPQQQQQRLDKWRACVQFPSDECDPALAALVSELARLADANASEQVRRRSITRIGSLSLAKRDAAESSKQTQGGRTSAPRRLSLTVRRASLGDAALRSICSSRRSLADIVSVLLDIRTSALAPLVALAACVALTIVATALALRRLTHLSERWEELTALQQLNAAHLSTLVQHTRRHLAHA